MIKLKSYSIPSWQAQIPGTAHGVSNKRFLHRILIQIEIFQPIITRRETPQQQSSTPSRHNNIKYHEKSVFKHGILLYFCFSYIIFTVIRYPRRNQIFWRFESRVANAQRKRNKKINIVKYLCIFNKIVRKPFDECILTFNLQRT